MDIGKANYSLYTLARFDVYDSHIDTAEMYGNEKEVWQAVRDSGIKREEIFISKQLTYLESRGAQEPFLASKVPPNSPDAAASVKNSAEKLNLGRRTLFSFDTVA